MLAFKVLLKGLRVWHLCLEKVFERGGDICIYNKIKEVNTIQIRFMTVHIHTRIIKGLKTLRRNRACPTYAVHDIKYTE